MATVNPAIDIPDEVILRGLQAMIDALIVKYDELGMVATGNWARQLEARVENGVGKIMGADYTQFLTQGRPPSDSLPPIQPIITWMKAKGIQGNPWAIAQGIKNNGTTWYRKGGSDLLEVLRSPEVAQAFNTIVGEYFVVRISEELRRTIKQINR